MSASPIIHYHGGRITIAIDAFSYAQQNQVDLQFGSKEVLRYHPYSQKTLELPVEYITQSIDMRTLVSSYKQKPLYKNIESVSKEFLASGFNDESLKKIFNRQLDRYILTQESYQTGYLGLENIQETAIDLYSKHMCGDLILYLKSFSKWQQYFLLIDPEHLIFFNSSKMTHMYDRDAIQITSGCALYLDKFIVGRYHKDNNIFKNMYGHLMVNSETLKYNTVIKNLTGDL